MHFMIMKNVKMKIGSLTEIL